MSSLPIKQKANLTLALETLACPGSFSNLALEIAQAIVDLGVLFSECETPDYGLVETMQALAISLNNEKAMLSMRHSEEYLKRYFAMEESYAES